MKKLNQNAGIINCQNTEKANKIVVDKKYIDEKVADQKEWFAFLNQINKKEEKEFVQREKTEWCFDVPRNRQGKAELEKLTLEQIAHIQDFCKMVVFCKLRYMVLNTDQNQINATNKARAEGYKQPTAKFMELPIIQNQVYKVDILNNIKPVFATPKVGKTDYGKCYDIAEILVQEAFAEYFLQVSECPVVKSKNGVSVFEGKSFADMVDNQEQFAFLRNRIARVVRQYFEDDKKQTKISLDATMTNDEGEEVEIGQGNSPSAERGALAKIEIEEIFNKSCLTERQIICLQYKMSGFTVKETADDLEKKYNRVLKRMDNFKKFINNAIADGKKINVAKVKDKAQEIADEIRYCEDMLMTEKAIEHQLKICQLKIDDKNDTWHYVLEKITTRI